MAKAATPKTTAAPDYKTAFIPCLAIECFSDIVAPTDYGLELCETKTLPELAMSSSQRAALALVGQGVRNKTAIVALDLTKDGSDMRYTNGTPSTDAPPSIEHTPGTTWASKRSARRSCRYM